VGSTAPNVVPAGSAGNSRGELWVNNGTTIPGLNYYTGSAFVNLTPSGTLTTAGLVELATAAETQAGTDGIRAVTPSGLQSKISDSTSTASSTTIASSAAVKQAYDLAAAAVAASGTSIITGELLISSTGSLVFEGSVDDSFETTLAVVNPTADRTITLPNITGTVVTTGDTNTVTGTMIASGTITNTEISASAAIGLSKLATGALPSGITVNSANIVDNSIVNADINSSAAIAYSKLALSSGIVNTDISASAAIALSKLATGALPTGITVSSGNIVDGTITNADVSASAAIVDTKLATIATAGKVSNSATTATSANTNSAIVARDGSGNFSANTITAALSGNASTATALSTARTFALTGNVTGSISSNLTSGASIAATIASGVVTSAMIADGAIVNADVNNSAAIAYSKLALSSGIVNTDISASAAIALSKLATGALPTGITVSSGNIVDGTITNADINASAAIALSKLATGALPAGITVASANIVDGTIVNADINASAAIAISKIAALDSSQYTPVAGTFSNLDAATIASNGFQWIRVGQHVMVNGRVGVDATASGDWSFRLSLPITKSAGFGGTGEANGTGNSRNATEYSATVQSLTGSTTEVTVLGRGSVTSSINVFLSFMYLL
jgi:hypothetical protein